MGDGPKNNLGDMLKLINHKVKPVTNVNNKVSVSIFRLIGLVSVIKHLTDSE